MPVPAQPPRTGPTFAAYLRHMCAPRFAAQAWNLYALADGVRLFVIGLAGIMAVGAIVCGIAYFGYPPAAREASSLALTAVTWTLAAIGGPRVGVSTYPLVLMLLVLVPYVLAQRTLQRRRPIAGLWPLLPRVVLPALAVSLAVTLSAAVGGLITAGLDALYFAAQSVATLIIAGLVGRNLGLDRASRLAFRALFPRLAAARAALATAVTHLAVFGVICTLGTALYRSVVRPDDALLFLLTQPMYGAQDTSFLYALVHLGGVVTPAETVMLTSRLHFYTIYALFSTSTTVYSPHVFPAAVFAIFALVVTLFVTGARYGLQRGGEIRGGWAAWWHLPVAYAALQTPVIAAAVWLGLDEGGGAWNVQLAPWSALAFAACGVVVFVVAKTYTYTVASALSPRSVRWLAGRNLSAYWGEAIDRWHADEGRIYGREGGPVGTPAPDPRGPDQPET